MLEDPGRILLLSGFSKIELIPKPAYFKEVAEVAFIDLIFAKAEYIPFDESVFNKAWDMARRYGLGAIDAFHVASACLSGADEMVSSEGPTKPFYRIPSSELRIISLHD